MKKNLPLFLFTAHFQNLIKTISLFFVLILLPREYAFAQCAQGILYDSFETGSYSPNWVSQGSSGTYTVTSGGAAQGTFKLDGTGITATHLTGLMATLSSVTPTSVSWYMYTNTASTGACNYFVFGDNSITTTNCIAFVYYNPTSGGISFASSTSFLYSCTSGAWYKMELKNINYTSHTFDIWINNTLQQSNFPFRSTTQNNIARIHLYTFTANTYSSWDAIQIGSGITISANSTSVSCPGGSNGSATLTTQLATAPITYTWIGSTSTSSIANNLSAGSYTVNMTDANSCTATTTFSVTQPSTITPNYSVTNAKCFGGSSGSATIAPTGGTAPFTQLWSTSATSSVVSNLPAGTYTCTITDSHSCAAVSTVAVSQPSTPVSATAVVSDIRCFGQTNGSVAITPGGGTGPYTYMWSAGNVTTSTIQNLALGTYTCIIYDANNCNFSTIAIINQPTVLSGALTQTNITCVNQAAAKVTPAGGTAPYSYTWTPWGGNTALMTNLSQGSHNCIVTDAHGCTFTQTVAITTNTVAPTVTAVSSRTSICKGEPVGLSVTGSADTYTWNTGSNSMSITVTPSTITMYTVTGTSASNGCTTSFVLTQYVKTCSGINEIEGHSFIISVYPNPTSGEFTLDVYKSVSISVFNMVGENLMNQNLTTGKNIVDLSTLPKGLYFIKISDQNKEEIARIVKN